MTSVNDALAASFDVDLQQIAATTTGLTIDKIEGLTASTGAVRVTTCLCGVTPTWPED